MEEEGRESELVLDRELATLRFSCEGRPLVVEEDMMALLELGLGQLAR